MANKILTAEKALDGSRREIPEDSLYNTVVKACREDMAYINEYLLPILHRAGIYSVTYEQLLALCEKPDALTEARDSKPHPVRYPSFIQYRGGRAVLGKRDLEHLRERETTKSEGYAAN